MDRMLSLAGYADLGEGEGRAAVLAAAESIGSKVESLHRDVRILVDSTAKPEPVDAYGVTVVGGYLLVTIRRAADSNQGD